jgi:hypothetical protein
MYCVVQGLTFIAFIIRQRVEKGKQESFAMLHI